jgi:hypothetical protein
MHLNQLDNTKYRKLIITINLKHQKISKKCLYQQILVTFMLTRVETQEVKLSLQCMVMELVIIMKNG